MEQTEEDKVREAARRYGANFIPSVRAALIELYLSMSEELRKEYRNKVGSLPLADTHICHAAGHAMFSVYELDNFANNGRSQWGLHKCSRCGWEDYWQYDF